MADPNTPSRKSNGWGRAAAVIAIFALLGPAIGSLAFGVLGAVGSALFEPGAVSGMLFVYASVVFLPMAYLTGGLQALFTGVVTALHAWRKGSAPLWVPVAAAIVAGAAVQSRLHEDVAMTSLMIAVHIVAAACCWAMARLVLGWR